MARSQNCQFREGDLEWFAGSPMHVHLSSFFLSAMLDHARLDAEMQLSAVLQTYGNEVERMIDMVREEEEPAQLVNIYKSCSFAHAPRNVKMAMLDIIVIMVAAAGGSGGRKEFEAMIAYLFGSTFIGQLEEPSLFWGKVHLSFHKAVRGPCGRRNSFRSKNRGRNRGPPKKVVTGEPHDHYMTTENHGGGTEVEVGGLRDAMVGELKPPGTPQGYKPQMQPPPVVVEGHWRPERLSAVWWHRPRGC